MVKLLNPQTKGLISVILPTYNSNQYLSESIISILRQTYKNFELIIVDDGSTDESINLINSFLDDRIRIIQHKQRRGIVKSLNEAMAISKGEYIARMDSDDVCTPDRFECQINVLKDKNIGLVCTNVVSIDKNGELIGKHWWRKANTIVNDELIWTNPVAHPSIMIRRSIVKKYKNLPFAEDYDLWTRLSLRNKIFRIGKVHLFHRIHDNSLIAKYKKKSQDVSILINKKYIEKRFGIVAPDFHKNLTTFVGYGSVAKIYPLRNYIRWVSYISDINHIKIITRVAILWNYFMKLNRSQKRRFLW